MALVFPENFESKIGFDKIRELLKEKCLSTLGAEWVEQICFKNDYETIRHDLP
jgi:DNA mismatch repair protein MutS2